MNEMRIVLKSDLDVQQTNHELHKHYFWIDSFINGTSLTGNTSITTKAHLAKTYVTLITQYSVTKNFYEMRFIVLSCPTHPTNQS
jgi:hypothetical protein